MWPAKDFVQLVLIFTELQKLMWVAGFFCGVHSALNCHPVKPCHFLTYLPDSKNWDTLWVFFFFAFPKSIKPDIKHMHSGKAGNSTGVGKKKTSEMKLETCTLDCAFLQFALNVTTIKVNWWLSPGPLLIIFVPICLKCRKTSKHYQRLEEMSACQTVFLPPRACWTIRARTKSLQVLGGRQTYLSVGHTDEAFVDQLFCFRVPRLAFHDVTLCCLVSQWDGWNLEEMKKGNKTKLRALLQKYTQTQKNHARWHFEWK